MVYNLLLPLLYSHETGVPKNIPEEPYYSSYVGENDNWVRGGTNPSLFAWVGGRYHIPKQSSHKHLFIQRE